MNNAFKYLILILIGVIIYILSYDKERFSIGIPNTPDKIILSFKGNTKDHDLSGYHKHIFVYDEKTEKIKWISSFNVPPEGKYFGPTIHHLKIQDILFKYIDNAIQYALENYGGTDDEDFNTLITQLYAILLSFRELSLYDYAFIIWILSDDNISPFINLFRDNLRLQIGEIIEIEIINSCSSFPKKRKIS